MESKQSQWLSIDDVRNLSGRMRHAVEFSC
jgi:hypothetical protein